ncbi:MAG TPA: TetR family transcriptional regulator [Solirubrobacterales bacterium]|nr:TetR family transcriptional regulator [Solirubrobacterales bacterium]
MAKRRFEHRESGRAEPSPEAEKTELQEATERALLVLSGERGYTRTTVAEVLRRSGSNRTRFYSTWTSKEDCFGSAYAAAAEPLAARLLAACDAASDWGTGVAAALTELGRFTAREPSLAAGLLGEVRVAGGTAPARREELVERLARAIDRGRGNSLVSPPPYTARFLVEAIEATAIRSLAMGQPLDEVLPDLLFLAYAYYRGLPEARQAVRRFSVARR